MTSYVTLTTAVLRDLGYDYDEVQRRVPAKGAKWGGRGLSTISVDFCGFGDLIAFRPATPGVLAINVCGHAELAPHTAHYRSDKPVGRRGLPIVGRIRQFLDGTGNRFQVWGWEEGRAGWRVLVLSATLLPDGAVRFLPLERPA